VLPLVYALLPNKTEVTYKMFFTMIKSSLNIEPFSITSDFELATLNAIKKIFPIRGLSEYLTKYKSFKDQFNLLRSLPFVSEDKVIDAFKLIKSEASIKFKPLIKYFESFYIGKLKKGSKTFRDDARFPISLWSVYKRGIDNFPRTNNSFESWSYII
ncbi:unnamed protein product, partial [Brachionus calyciflorus]